MEEATRDNVVAKVVNLSSLGNLKAPSLSKTAKRSRPLSKEQALKLKLVTQQLRRRDLRIAQSCSLAIRAEDRRKARFRVLDAIRSHPRDRRAMRKEGTFEAYVEIVNSIRQVMKNRGAEEAYRYGNTVVKKMAIIDKKADNRV